MSFLSTLGWITAAVALAAAIYAFHRLSLRLEERGYIYYWHRKPQTSASRMWTPLQEMLEPQIRHLEETKQHHRAGEDDPESDPETPRAWREPA